MRTSYDVVVVGAGIAGAVFVWKLSQLKPSANILLLDAGDNPIGNEIRERFVQRFALSVDRGVLGPYRRLQGNLFAPSPEGGVDSKHFVQAGPDKFKSNYVRLVGGTGWSWRGNCPRWVPNDFRMRSAYGIADDWPFTYDDIEPYFCDAETELGVAADHAEQAGLPDSGIRSRPYPMPKIIQALGDIVVKGRVDGMDVDGKTITVVATPQARNSVRYQDRSECLGNANCIPICPSGAKYDATVHLRRLMQANAAKPENDQQVHLKWHRVVTRLETASNGSIKGVYFRDWRKTGTPEEFVSGKLIVLATHAIETPRLWLSSKLDNSRDLIGRNLMDHLAHEVTGYMDQLIYPFRGPQNTSSIFDFRDGEFRRRCSAFNITVGNDGWGRKLSPGAALDKMLWDSSRKRIRKFGGDLIQELASGDKAINRMIRISYSTEQLPEADNRVTLADEKDPLGLPRPKISYKVSDYSIRGLEFGHSVAHRILKKAVSDDEHDAERRIDHTPDANPTYNGAGHPMGTCRMGTSATNSVVDSFGQSHAHPNLYLIGSSVFVTGSSVNPTLLLTALTLRTAESVVTRL